MNDLEYKNAMPVVPLRDVVVFPRVVMSLYVGRQMSLDALNKAMEEGGQVFLATQKVPETDEPKGDDLHDVGCVANVLQMLRLPDSTVKVLVEGISRARAVYIKQEDSDALLSEITLLPTTNAPEESEAVAVRRALIGQITSYAKVNSRLGDDLLAKIKEIDDLGRLTDHIISAFPISLEKRQLLLEITDLSERIDKLLAHVAREIEEQKIERKIRGRVKNQMEKNHREYYLQEQARAIQRELSDDQNAEMDSLKKRVGNAGMSKQALEKCEQELKKLKSMPPMSAEATVTRTYLETVLALPWNKRSPVGNTPIKARKILDDDHYGLDKIKERIVEYLAVQKRMPNGKAPILCFVGPPGVGKTSLGRSIASATGRVFGRISLGGVRDEAEIRGHRKTYVGSMPGKVINAMTRAGVKNPIILLDEIDKMGYDFRGDPSSALLEVLDPEQNTSFVDHYVEVDFDLSEVMFITTANNMDIPPALLDRLEIIRLSGYTEDERVNIAQRHLIPRQFKETGIEEGEAVFSRASVIDIIRYYTREAGVRALERTISKICRKIVLQSEREKEKKRAVRQKRVIPATLEKYLGVRQHRYGLTATDNKVGQVTGLVWTSVGGDLLSIESCHFTGRGKIIRTGKLGQVLQESVDTAFSAVRSRCEHYQIKPATWRDNDFHIHLPEGAIPKDGPSAGIGIATAILSTVTNVPVRADTAMTGEITLRGEVLPIGGLKEKLLAAGRSGIKRVILPKENEKDLSELAPEIKNKFEICLVTWVDEVFELALTEKPALKKKTPVKKRRTLVPPIGKSSDLPKVITH
ncbi:endopeptidase La [Candidatus Persebacteraceae bacterium Df01]|jgi:ATP-dependent Lon protease|uniref:Lon protease n=1 Tax=Candidatus Doriopsillibacter californiensis TaxID=2970740 RepID=A0ABT7QL05_9GAMM|nr:endopeptidase La [Candidatus Persebacteraceae bacterium Df01]